MIWFTSDTHFGHETIIKHSKRPFASVEEMDHELVERWNAVVKPRDDVWHLGDVTWWRKGLVPKYVPLLSGRKHLVLGNHDEFLEELLEAFLTVQSVKVLKWYHQRFFLSHYAHRVWPASHRGGFHLFGHTHNKIAGVGRSMDVGVDAHNFTPVRIDEVYERLNVFPQYLDIHSKGGAMC